ncbi:MAG TPA: alpha/beta hydrolase [Acidimicrobiales bacterium]|nr:alpha/beta hydrolase [Acidimicrobiales bacterium]
MAPGSTSPTPAPPPPPTATPSHTVPLGGGRAMAVDEVGDPAGAPVVYLHGTPDSRLARHPDDGLAAVAGVRLLAIDRPGYGGSSPPPHPPAWSPEWPAAVAGDVAQVLDARGVERCAVLAWSGGALTGLALAAGLPGRVAGLGVVAGLVPRQAYDDPEVRAAAEARVGMVELADVVAPGELGVEVAPTLAPFPCDLALAAEHQAEHRSAADAAELATVPGGAERMAHALVEAVRPGLAGVAADAEAQARPLAVDLAAVACPVHLWYGTADVVTPPAFGRWYAARLPGASLAVVEGAAHYLAFTAWPDLLATLAADVVR